MSSSSASVWAAIISWASSAVLTRILVGQLLKREHGNTNAGMSTRVIRREAPVLQHSASIWSRRMRMERYLGIGIIHSVLVKIIMMCG